MKGAGVIPIRVGTAGIVIIAGNAQTADVRGQSSERSGRAADARGQSRERSGRAVDARGQSSERNVRAAIPRDRSRGSRSEMHACVINRKQRISAGQTAYLLPMDFSLWGEKTEKTLPAGTSNDTLKTGNINKMTKIR